MNLELTSRHFSVYCYSFVPNCRKDGGDAGGVGGCVGVKLQFWGGKTLK